MYPMYILAYHSLSYHDNCINPLVHILDFPCVRFYLSANLLLNIIAALIIHASALCNDHACAYIFAYMTNCIHIM